MRTHKKTVHFTSFDGCEIPRLKPQTPVLGIQTHIQLYNGFHLFIVYSTIMHKLTTDVLFVDEKQFSKFHLT